MIWVNGREVVQDHFAAGELKINLWPSSKSRIDLVWHYENDAELFTVACIREYYATQDCILYLPYLPSARMDRVKNPEDVFTLKTFAHLINALNFSTVYVWDAHSNVGPALIDRCVNGINIFKRPKALTWKKSQKGCCVVALDGESYTDERAFEDTLGEKNLLQTVFYNGKLTNRQSLAEIRERLWGKV